jgi:hypothetical protein
MTTGNQAMSLEDLVRRLEDDLEQTQRRGKRRIATLAVLILVVLGYLSWIHTQVVRMDAEAVSDVATGYVLANLPQVKQQLRAELIDAAPQLTDEAKRALLGAPRFFRKQIEAALPYASSALALRLEDELTAHLTMVVEELADLPEERRNVKDLVEDARAAYQGMLLTIIDDMHGQFAGAMRDLNKRLRELQTSKKLTPRQKVEKELIEASVVLMDWHGVSEAAFGDIFELRR